MDILLLSVGESGVVSDFVLHIAVLYKTSSKVTEWVTSNTYFFLVELFFTIDS